MILILYLLISKYRTSNHMNYIELLIKTELAMNI